MEASKVLAPVFIETEDLQKLIEGEVADLKIFDCTVLSPEDGDAILNFHKEHISG
jgi:hypothetical protein